MQINGRFSIFFAREFLDRNATLLVGPVELEDAVSWAQVGNRDRVGLAGGGGTGQFDAVRYVIFGEAELATVVPAKANVDGIGLLVEAR